MYVLPSDGSDRHLDIEDVLENSVGSWQTWLTWRAAERRTQFRAE
jgi:hypothetical protein